MKCVSIIWNCAVPLENEILNIIECNANITDTFKLDLGTSYNNFVRMIYEKDSIADWKVNEKIKHMDGFGTVVRIVYFDVNVSETFFNPYKKNDVYCKLELLKLLIRTICMNKITDYFYDISFHCSDSKTEYKFDVAVIENFTHKTDE